MSSAIITAQHRAAFDAFGFVKFPELFKDDIDWINDEYEAVWRLRPDIVHTSKSGLTLFPGLFVAWSERLSRLLEDPRITALGNTLLGDGWSLTGGDGGLYNGD